MICSQFNFDINYLSRSISPSKETGIVESTLEKIHHLNSANKPKMATEIVNITTFMKTRRGFVPSISTDTALSTVNRPLNYKSRINCCTLLLCYSVMTIINRLYLKSLRSKVHCPDSQRGWENQISTWRFLQVDPSTAHDHLRDIP